MSDYYLAIDIGASSGRHILGQVVDGKLTLEEIYRFENRQYRSNGHDCWDIPHLWKNILEGLKVCKKIDKLPRFVGIDTWAVDYVLLDGKDQVIGDVVAYRDARTEGMDREAEKQISFEELYARTGIQKMNFNSIYQLLALKQEHPDQLNAAKSFLMIPDYFHFLLTGKKVQEYTNATTTALVHGEKKTWDPEVIERVGLPMGLFGNLTLPGTILGPFTKEIEESVGYSSVVCIPASHDTGSAFLAVPAKDETSVFLSSGTWSLLGVENERPITSEASRIQNFTNEGGAWYRYRYLKNIMGLWMIQSVRRELNDISYIEGKKSKYVSDRIWSYPDLMKEAMHAEYFTSVVDVNADCFLSPDSMIDAIKAACRKTDQPVPESIGEIMQCVYRSLAQCYQEAIQKLSSLTGITYTALNIVGGGCQDRYLNQLTANVCGIPVFAGPTEGTAIGNLLMQMIAGGDYQTLSEARESIRKSFSVEEYLPEK